MKSLMKSKLSFTFVIIFLISIQLAFAAENIPTLSSMEDAANSVTSTKDVLYAAHYRDIYASIHAQKLELLRQNIRKVTELDSQIKNWARLPKESASEELIRLEAIREKMNDLIDEQATLRKVTDYARYEYDRAVNVWRTAGNSQKAAVDANAKKLGGPGRYSTSEARALPELERYRAFEPLCQKARGLGKVATIGGGMAIGYNLFVGEASAEENLQDASTGVYDGVKDVVMTKAVPVFPIVQIAMFEPSGEGIRLFEEEFREAQAREIVMKAEFDNEIIRRYGSYAAYLDVISVDSAIYLQDRMNQIKSGNDLMSFTSPIQNSIITPLQQLEQIRDMNSKKDGIDWVNQNIPQIVPAP